MQRYDAPLYNAIDNAAAKAVARFCMPGHSGNGAGVLSCARWDLTEIEGLDNMLSPEGVIADAQRLAARAYRAEHALFFTAGATSAMHTALAIARDKGNVWAIGRLHKSFYGGCALLGIEPVCFDGIEAFAASDARGGTAFFNYVDYFGCVADDAPLAKFCKERGVTLVADSAHGAHFPFCKKLPRLPLADVAIYGMHKTLPVMGGGALMTASDDRLADEAAYARSLVHTTSPSYLTMATMDLARAVYERDGEEIFADILAARRKFEAENASGYKVVPSDDFSRLVLMGGGYDATELTSFLTQKGIYPEAAIADRAVFILTRDNAPKLPLLAQALKEFKPTRRLAKTPAPAKRERKDARGAVEFVALSEACGRGAAAEVGLYPPGVPFIQRGEAFTAEDVRYLSENAHLLFGLVNGRVVVVK